MDGGPILRHVLLSELIDLRCATVNDLSELILWSCLKWWGSELVIYLVYVVAILVATTVCSVVGLGGGLIIKPVLDAIGYHDVATTGMLSSLAVFTMCVASLVRQMRSGFSFDRTVVVWISLGSLIGGMVGEHVFSMLAAAYGYALVKAVQAAALSLTLVLILVYTLISDRLPHFRLKSPWTIGVAGLVLGAISVFLGIGGGPLNVACMTCLFSYSLKEASVYSLATIFFSQASKLTVNALSGVLFTFDVRFVVASVIPAVAGGLMGTRINRRSHERVLRGFYVALMVALTLLSVANCVLSLKSL